MFLTGLQVVVLAAMLLAGLVLLGALAVAVCAGMGRGQRAPR